MASVRQEQDVSICRVQKHAKHSESDDIDRGKGRARDKSRAVKEHMTLQRTKNVYSVLLIPIALQMAPAFFLPSSAWASVLKMEVPSKH
jgi:hypothetical protein